MNARRSIESTLMFSSLRPLVRYVDAELAVLEVHAGLRWFPSEPRAMGRWAGQPVSLRVEVDDESGFHDEMVAEVDLARGCAVARMDFVQPEAWWPAGMGEQALHRLTVTLARGEETLDRRQMHVGLSTVRSPGGDVIGQPYDLVVNGRPCPIEHVIPVDERDERTFLPVRGHSVLLVRGHYGPDVLYDAADRAGVLLLQCVPLDARGEPECEMPRQISRLAAHPSLVGWFVGHLGDLSERIAEQLAVLDPSRGVYRTVHGLS